MDELYFLDAQTHNKQERITAFGGDYESLTKDFRDWVTSKHLTPKDIWYADIFEHISKNQERHIFSLKLLESGEIEVRTPLKPVKNAYRRGNKLFHLR